MFDVVGKMICRQDPERRTDKSKAMYCMINGNHVCALSNNLDSFQKNVDANPGIYVQAQTDYCIEGEPTDMFFI